MCMKRIRTMFMFFLAFVMLFTTTVPAYAASASSCTVSSNTNNTQVTFGDGFIRESFTIAADSGLVYVSRTTYEDGRAVWEVTEDGETTTFTVAGNYQALLQSMISPTSRQPGYSYLYLTTMENSGFTTPEGEDAAAIIGAIASIIAEKVPGGIIPAPLIGALAQQIANKALGSPVPIRITMTRHWYEMTETASGGFIGYYCEYVIKAEVQDSSGAWVYVSSESGDWESMTIF